MTCAFHLMRWPGKLNGFYPIDRPLKISATVGSEPGLPESTLASRQAL